MESAILCHLNYQSYEDVDVFLWNNYASLVSSLVKVSLKMLLRNLKCDVACKK